MDPNADFSSYCKSECRSAEAALDSAKTQDEFLAINQRLSFLESRLNERAASLPSYTLKQLQSALNSVKQRASQAHAAAIPKAKFSFAKRAEKPKKAENNQSSDARAQNASQKDETTSAAEQRDLPEPAKQIIEKHAALSQALRIADLSNQTVCKYEADCTPDARDAEACRVLELSNLDNCRVLVCYTTSTIHCDALRDCVVICAPSRGSVFVDCCTNCLFVFGAQQLRVHRTKTCRFAVHITAGSIIEDCTDVHFAPWPDKLYSRFGAALLEHQRHDAAVPATGNDDARQTTNNWHNVEDFNHLDRTTHSPNWIAVDQLTDPDLQAIDAFTELQSPPTTS